METKYSLDEIHAEIERCQNDTIKLISPCMWEYYKEGVELGDNECAFLLARSYYISGEGKEEFLVEASKLYENCIKNKYNEDDAKVELVSLILQSPFIFKQKIKKAYSFIEEVYSNGYVEVYIEFLVALAKLDDDSFESIKKNIIKAVEKQMETSLPIKTVYARCLLGEFNAFTTEKDIKKALKLLDESARGGDRDAFDLLLEIYVKGGNDKFGVSSKLLYGNIQKAFDLIDSLDLSPMSKLWQKNLICNFGKYSYYDVKELHEIISLEKGAECIAKMNMLFPINANHVLSYYIDLETTSVDKKNIFDLVYQEACILKENYEKTQSYCCLKGAMLLADSNVRRDFVHAKSQEMLEELLNIFELTKKENLDLYNFDECEMIAQQEFWDLNDNSRLLNIDVENKIEKRYKDFRNTLVKYFKKSNRFKGVDNLILYLFYNMLLISNENFEDNNSSSNKFLFSLVKKFSKVNDKVVATYINELLKLSKEGDLEEEYKEFLDVVAYNFNSNELLNLRVLLYMISIYLWEEVSLDLDEIIKSFSFKMVRDRVEKDD